VKPLSAKDLHKAYRATFGSEKGQAVLEDLRRVAGMGRPSYVPGDAMETVFRDGKKSLIYMIEQHLNGGEIEEQKDIPDEEEDVSEWRLLK
jgi:hypothetical protein